MLWSFLNPLSLIWGTEQTPSRINRIRRVDPLLVQSRDDNPGIDRFFHTSNVCFVYL
jgi:hypothetical protein